VTDPRRIAALARIAALRKEAEVAAFAVAKRQARAIGIRIGALDEALAEARQTAAGSADPATFAAQDAFGRWSDAQRLGLTERLLEAEALAEARRDAARLAFGRAEVLERLTRKAEADRRLRRAKS
jgi:hypothetical protein